MTISQVAKQLELSKHIITNWVARGYIPSKKIGRRRLVDIRQLINSIDDNTSIKLKNKS